MHPLHVPQYFTFIRRCIEYVHTWEFLLTPYTLCSCVIDDAEYNSYCQWYDYLMTTQRPHLDLIGESALVFVHLTQLLLCVDEESERRLWLFQHYLYSIPPLPEVYLRTSPEVCMQRIQQRGRQEEKPVTVVGNKSERTPTLPVALHEIVDNA